MDRDSNKLRDKLTKEERALLSDFYESDTRKIIEKILGVRQTQLAMWVLTLSNDHDYTLQNRGRVSEDKWFIDFLEDNYKAYQKERKSNT